MACAPRNVIVPPITRELKRSVFLSGNFHQVDKDVVDWSPRAYQMKRVDATHWTVSLGAMEGTHIEYKYTLGDWDHVEQNEHCRDISNRRVTFSGTSLRRSFPGNSFTVLRLKTRP